MAAIAFVVMKGVVFEGVQGPQLSLDAVLRGGLHWVWGNEGDGARELVKVVGGVARPEGGGRVLVDGIDVYRNPAVRRGVGVAWGARPAPVGSQTVEMFASWLDGLRGAPEGATVRELRSLGLASLLGRPVAALSPTETYQVEVGAALSVPSPRVVAVWLRSLAGLDGTSLATRFQALAEDTVVIVASELAPPQHLGVTRWLFRGGSLFDRSAPDTTVLPGRPTLFDLEVVAYPDWLEEVTHALPSTVSAVEELPSGRYRVKLETSDRGAMAAQLTATLAARDQAVVSLRTSSPSLAHAQTLAPRLVRSGHENAPREHRP